MLHKTKGIVLHTLPYNDKYLILNIYTECFGRVSYMASNTRRKKSKIPHSLFIPLSILDMEVEHLNNRDIQRIKEAKTSCQLTQMRFDPIKNTIAMFISEVLYRVIQEKEANAQLFEYLYYSIQRLELASEGTANFHLTFLFRLSTYLGIHPNKDSYKTGCFFDLLNGIFANEIPEHNHYLNRKDSVVFARLLKINFENMALFSFTRQERMSIIKHIIEYYRLHLSDFPEIKSLAIMQNLFDSSIL